MHQVQLTPRKAAQPIGASLDVGAVAVVIRESRGGVVFAGTAENLGYLARAGRLLWAVGVHVPLRWESRWFD